MARRWLEFGAVMVTALGSAGCAPAVPPAPPPPVQVESAMFVSGRAGESVLVFAAGFASYGKRAIDRVGSSDRYRYLRLHSLENGSLLASEIFDHDYHYVRYFDEPTCEPALPGRLWCLAGLRKGLTVRDAESLRTIADQSQILGGTPELAGTEPLNGMRVDPQTRGFVFESRDGYAWIIDPTTLAPARFAGTLRSVPRKGDFIPSSLRSRRESAPVIGDYEYSLDGETRKTLGRSLPDAPHGALHPEHTYLRGDFVKSGGVPILLDDPPRVLVIEEAVDHGPTVWCLFADGTAQSKVTDLPGPLVDAEVYRDTVVLVTSRMLVAVRTRDGVVVWTSAP